MANDGKHKKPRNSVFSQPARREREEREPSSGADYSGRRTAYHDNIRPAGGRGDEYGERSRRYTEPSSRPAGYGESPTRGPASYTERPARPGTYTERPARPNTYTERPDTYTQRPAGGSRPAAPDRSGGHAEYSAPVGRPSAYTERVHPEQGPGQEPRRGRGEARPASRPGSVPPEYRYQPPAEPVYERREPRRNPAASAPVPPRTSGEPVRRYDPERRSSSRGKAYYKSRRRVDGGLILAIILLLGLLAFVIYKLFGGGMDKPAEKPETPPVEEVTPVPVTPAPTEEPTPTPVPTPSGDAARLADGRIVPADWGVIVPEREEAKYNSFFDRSLMMGNSLAEGFYMWAGLSDNFTFITHANLWVDKVIGGIDLSKLTENPGAYDSVYLMFGLNEIGNSAEKFIQDYSNLIDFIREYQPEAIIYVQSVTPVTKEVDADPGEVQKMDRIDNFNEKLKVMCEEKGCWYIDIYTMLLDEEGFLSKDYAFAGDGKHFEKSGYVAWADYLKTHYVDEGLLPAAEESSSGEAEPSPSGEAADAPASE